MNNKKSFIKGAALGVLSSLIIFSAVLAGGFYYGLLKVDTNSTPDVETAETKFSDQVSTKLDYIMTIIDKYYLDEYDKEKMITGMYTGLLASMGDPYTVYYDEEGFSSLMESNEGVYYGIGVVVQQDPQTLVITVNYPYEEGPGAEAGILPGDIICGVAGKDVSGMDINEVVAMIRGEEGTFIEVEVLHAGETEPVVLNVERRKIETHTVEHEVIEGNIGYVQVVQFEEVTPEQFKAALDDFKAQGIEKVIIDLRDNPGGSLDAVMSMMDMLLPKGLYTYLEDKNGNRQDYKGYSNPSFDFSTAILVNGNSASASELFTGAMSDYEKAVVVGETTFGKGIVQQIYPLMDGTGIKVTMAKYYTPNGVCIHKTGIEPDYVVSLDEGEYASLVEFEEDNQLQKAIEILNK